MIVDKVEDLKACVKNGVPCADLMGFNQLKPLIVSCACGNNCRVCECCFYREDKYFKKSD